jgi:hypothetical protein
MALFVIANHGGKSSCGFSTVTSFCNYEIVVRSLLLAMDHLRLIHTYHAVPLPCRAKKGLDCVFPILFTQCGPVCVTHAVSEQCHDHALLKGLCKAMA